VAAVLLVVVVVRIEKQICEMTHERKEKEEKRFMKSKEETRFEEQGKK
jgi:hypothetical protein